MTSIKLTVTGAKARAAVDGPLTSGMVGIPVTIEYDEAWDGLSKTFVCRCSKWGHERGETRTTLNIEQTATVAHEVMQGGMILYLGIEGYSPDGTQVIPTTWADCGKIQYGANAGGDPSADPELPIWAQLQEQIGNILQSPVADAQIAAAVEDYLKENPIEVPDIPGQPTGGGSGWSTDEILLLETVLKNCVMRSEQTNNIEALVTMLRSNASGPEDSGGTTETTYKVTLALTNVTPSNMAQSVAAGSVYMNQLSVNEGYVLGTPVITMGGFDVTSQYYDGDGTIAITDVAGDIVITCKALAVETVTIVRSAAIPDPATFEWTVGEANYWVAEPCSFTGGKMRVDFDAETFVKWGFILYLIDSEGTPYKISANAPGTTANADGVTMTMMDPATTGYGYVTVEAPFEHDIPTGCRAMLCIRRGSGTSANGAIANNADFANWIEAGGIAITVTEGE